MKCQFCETVDYFDEDCKNAVIEYFEEHITKYQESSEDDNNEEEEEEEEELSEVKEESEVNVNKIN